MRPLRLNIIRRCHFLLVLLLAVPAFLVSSRAQTKHRIEPGEVKEINVERLPDLNVPRSTHATLCVNGEYVTFGGHTTGFIPTPTAEYYRDGEWHVMNMVYAHDGGLVMSMKLGQVLLAGGFEKHLGIGQTFVVERYDPVSHSFQGFGCLNCKRAMASAVELDDGRVIISGNWYDADAIEQFGGHNTFTFLKAPTVNRVCPFMLRMRNGNVLIFGSLGSYDKDIPGDYMVDQLQGEAFHVPLLDTWRPLNYNEQDMDNVHWFIGDEAKGRYAYLIPVRSTEGEMGLVQVEDTTFTLLPTAEPIPTHAGEKKINYRHPMAMWWSDAKTIYDPCPPGWKVPSKTEMSTVQNAVDLPGVGFIGWPLSTDFAYGNPGSLYYWTSTGDTRTNAYSIDDAPRPKSGHPIRPVQE